MRWVRCFDLREECGPAGGAVRTDAPVWLGPVFEVLHPDTLEPVRPGEVGELVVTNLAVEGSPYGPKDDDLGKRAASSIAGATD